MVANLRRRCLTGRRGMSVFLTTAIVILVVYAGLCYLLWANQRSLLYRPWKFLIDPRLCAINGVELVDIHPSSEEKLYVWHYPPQAEGAPVIVYFDGNRGNISIWNRRWRRIAAAGAGFIALSYRGYGGSTQQPSEEGLHEDAQFAWDWAVRHYPESRLAIHGFSLGTGFATKLAGSVKTCPLILEAPYTSAVDRAAEMFPILPARLILKDRIETRKWIAAVEAPVMIAHGDKDMIVPIRHGRKLYKLAKKPKTFVKFKGANHLTMPAGGLYLKIWEFLGYDIPAPFAETAYAIEQEDYFLSKPLPRLTNAASVEPKAEVTNAEPALLYLTGHPVKRRTRREFVA